MNYEVVSKEQFARMSRSNLFIDQGSFNKELYATSVDSIRRIVQSGKICVLTMNSTVSFEFCFIYLLIMLIFDRQFQFILNFIFLFVLFINFVNFWWSVSVYLEFMFFMSHVQHIYARTHIVIKFKFFFTVSFILGYFELTWFCIL